MSAPYTGTDNLEIMECAVKYNAFLVDLVMRHAEIGSTTLDFGAGIGTFSEKIRARGVDVQCVEPDIYQSNVLQSKGFTVYRSLDEVADTSLSLIYSLNVIEHIEDDADVIAILHRKLGVGGRLLIYVPAFNLLYSKMDEKVGHYRRYRRSGLVGLLQKAGFEIKEARYVDSAGFFAAIAYKFLGSDDGDLNPATLKFYDRFIFPVSRVIDRLVQPYFGKNLFVTAVRH
jgi:SAM-dependent methyltransferase